MPRAKWEHVSRFELVVPSLGEQRAIAHVLGTLDDKIELNRRMNETLEAMARAIFKSWFVDFDPVIDNALRAGKPIPEEFAARAAARREALDAGKPIVPDRLARLFPDAFEDSEIGPVPKGWPVDQFAGHFAVSKGLSYKGKYLASVGEGLPMHNLNSVYEGGGYKHEGLKWYTGEHKDRHLVSPGDVIVTNTEQGFEFLLIGYAAIVPRAYGDVGLFSHHLYRVRPRPKSPIKPAFIYLLLRTQKYHDTVAGYTNGTTVNMLPKDGLEMPKFAVPEKQLLDRFYGLVHPILERVEFIYEENSALAAIRDMLLPKLLSGEIRVPDAEGFVETQL